MRCRLPVLLAMVVLVLPGPVAAADSADSEDLWASIGLHVLYGMRSSPESSPLVTVSGTGEEIFDADSFRFDGQPGGQLDVRVGIARGWTLTMVYRGYVTFSDETFTPPPGTAYLFYGQTPAAGDLALDQTYESQWQDAAIDFAYDPAPWVRLHGGFRWFHVSDDLEALSLRPGFSAGIRSETTNNLLGLQFGADFRLWGGTSRGELGVIVAGLRNDADGSVSLENSSGDVTTTVENSAQPNSVLAELDFRVVWPVSPRWSLVLGLEAVRVDHIADASSQPVASDNLLSVNPRMRLDDGGTLLLSTLSFGFEARF